MESLEWQKPHRTALRQHFHSGIGIISEPHRTAGLFGFGTAGTAGIAKIAGIGTAGTTGIAKTAGIRTAKTAHMFQCKYSQVLAVPVRFYTVLVILAIPEPHRSAGTASTAKIAGIGTAGTTGIAKTAGIGTAGTAIEKAGIAHA